MAKCKTEGCVNENIYVGGKEGDARREYCGKCVREFRHLPEAERLKVLAVRLAMDELWDAMMNLDEDSDGYFLDLINDACHDECNPRDDHNIVWQ